MKKIKYCECCLANLPQKTLRNPVFVDTSALKYTSFMTLFCTKDAQYVFFCQFYYILFHVNCNIIILYIFVKKLIQKLKNIDTSIKIILVISKIDD